MPPRDRHSESALYLLAGDLMNAPAVAAPETASIRSAARLMLDRGVGGVIALGEAGAPVGMVSDGDLMRRGPDAARRAWWLEMVVDSGSPRALPDLERPLRDVMSAPLISVSPRATVQEIAEALQAHRIKRLPVIDGGRLIGVVGRADLMCVVESVPAAPAAGGEEGRGLLNFLESLIGGASLRGGVERPAAAPPSHEARAAPQALTAASFRDAVQAHKAETVDIKQALGREAQLERRRQIKVLLDHHVSQELWRELLDHAELAARSGEQELMMLRFPSDLCSDGGRKIDMSEPGWETTLRGEAAELYSRWRNELKPSGFGLSARIVSFDDGGTIGDIGLYLTWGA